ncbi:hypothetical protein FV232_06425 [Methylobacterium sp. WL30]|jgi:hypothetical protein|uniref:hypothetical protein n=1 Tax=unclassified Methylobacterium TaxID=2615210 RepID=UPI0011C7CDD6|nr:MULTISPECIES: hypothetical protein [unclassified Methylobacterium]MCJ2007913.1 hypothetical protein [Methylobacterium sp. J-092]MCJ2112197.1 hypothetical protein [Methylobacterium sp. E-025]TXM90420.1 hypothetical protein FV223_18590 [Methylobacterium sp. WL116]TXN25523.1 hypothetical protein FV225_24700 [Methylobacterium sp. WL93]TXN53217.1 hypothetical protein FV227_00940 [Methylobacterium sp. WL119]
MRILVPAAAILALAGVQAATAQTTVIERGAPDTVVVDRPATESKTVETRESSDGCSTKTVTSTNDEGDRKTVRKERCD